MREGRNEPAEAAFHSAQGSWPEGLHRRRDSLAVPFGRAPHIRPHGAIPSRHGGADQSIPLRVHDIVFEMGLHELEVGRLRLDSDKAIGDRTHPGQGRDRIDSRTAPLGSSSMRVNWSWRAATAT